MPSLLSAASTALPESSEISRSLLGPPINTATLPNSLIRFSRDRACIESMGGCFALPHRPLRGTASGSPHQYRHFSEFTHTLLGRSCMHRVDGRMRSCHFLADDPDLGLQCDTGPLRDDVTDMFDQRFDICRLRAALGVHDE